MYVPASYVDNGDANGSLIPGEWRTEARESGVSDMHRFGSNMSTRDVMALREKFANYFVSPAGSVPWQNKMTSNAN